MGNNMNVDGIDHLCLDDLILGDRRCIDTPKEGEGAIRTAEDPR